MLSTLSPADPPTCELWGLHLLAQLEEARGDFEAALAFCDRCIAHTPTAVDMYERRARLLRKSGDLEGASLQMEAARKLDLADRYINNKSTKYLLRCGKTEEALATIGLFTKHDGDPNHNLQEMQVSQAGSMRVRISPGVIMVGLLSLKKRRSSPMEGDCAKMSSCKPFLGCCCPSFALTFLINPHATLWFVFVLCFFCSWARLCG